MPLETFSGLRKPLLSKIYLDITPVKLFRITEYAFHPNSEPSLWYLQTKCRDYDIGINFSTGYSINQLFVVYPPCYAELVFVPIRTDLFFNFVQCVWKNLAVTYGEFGNSKTYRNRDLMESKVRSNFL